MRVAVLGSSGRMGAFLARYFIDKGCEVRGADPHGARRGRAGGLRSFRTNSEAARGCDFVVLAVPMGRTLEVAREVVPALEPGSTLVEISSVKGETLGELRRMVGRRASLLSVHPLFGPALKSERAMKVAVIVSKRGGEEEAARRLFPEARIIPMTRREHDKAMGVVLSLTHLVNLAYAGAVARLLSPKEFMKVSTPNSSMQLTLAQAVLAQDAELSYEIQANNPYSREAGRAAVREIERVMGLVEAGDRKGFEEGFAKLAREYKVDERAGAVVKEIYSAAEDAG